MSNNSTGQLVLGLGLGLVLVLVLVLGLGLGLGLGNPNPNPNPDQERPLHAERLGHVHLADRELRLSAGAQLSGGQGNGYG